MGFSNPTILYLKKYSHLCLPVCKYLDCFSNQYLDFGYYQFVSVIQSMFFQYAYANVQCVWDASRNSVLLKADAFLVGLVKQIKKKASL